MNRKLLVCKILFGLDDSDFLTLNLYKINSNWNQTPYNIINYTKYLLEEELYILISHHINKQFWLNHLNENIKYVNKLNNFNNINNFNNYKLKQFIGVTGKKFNGKDTISNYLCDNFGYHKIALADLLKEICYIIFNFNEEQLYGNKKEILDPVWQIKPRYIYQYVGTELFRNKIKNIIPNIHNNFWIKCLSEKIKKILNIYPKIKFVISDIRFQNEIDIFKKEFDCNIIRVKRSNILNIDNHESELGIDNLNNIDYEILNNGNLYDLYNNIKKLLI